MFQIQIGNVFLQCQQSLPFAHVVVINYKCFSFYSPPPVDVLQTPNTCVPCLFLQIPTEYQQVAAHFSKVMDKDVREIAAAVSKSFNDQISARLKQRQGEMLGKMAELASRARINVDGAGPSTTDGDAGKTSMIIPSEYHRAHGGGADDCVDRRGWMGGSSIRP
jgi:hypothetical protein